MRAPGFAAAWTSTERPRSLRSRTTETPERPASSVWLRAFCAVWSAEIRASSSVPPSDFPSFCAVFSASVPCAAACVCRSAIAARPRAVISRRIRGFSPATVRRAAAALSKSAIARAAEAAEPANAQNPPSAENFTQRSSGWFSPGSRCSVPSASFVEPGWFSAIFAAPAALG